MNSSSKFPCFKYSSTSTLGKENNFASTHQNNSFLNQSNFADSVISMSNTNKSNFGISELGNPFFWPQYTISFPNIAHVGMPFDVILNYAFMLPTIDDDEHGVEFEVWSEPERQCPVEVCEDLFIRIVKQSNVDLLNRPDYVFDSNHTDTRYFPRISSELGYVHPAYNNTYSQQEIFQFVINKPTINYNYGQIEVSYPQSGDDVIHYYIDSNIIHLGSEIDHRFKQVSEDRFTDFSYMKNNTGISSHYDPQDQHRRYLANFYKTFHPNVDVEEYLKQGNFDDEFIKKFFIMYPKMQQ